MLARFVINNICVLVLLLCTWIAFQPIRFFCCWKFRKMDRETIQHTYSMMMMMLMTFVRSFISFVQINRFGFVHFLIYLFIFFFTKNKVFFSHMYRKEKQFSFQHCLVLDELNTFWQLMRNACFFFVVFFI